MIALVDCNTFYASCERIFRPDLNGKPIVVLSNNDGCIVAMSKEAKQLGIVMFKPAFQYQTFFDEHNVSVFSSNYPLYDDFSKRVMAILREYSPAVEVYSIDEAFVYFDGFINFDTAKVGAEIKNKIFKYTGIPVCVGFGNTKALAKTANKIAKKFPDRTNGIYAIDSEEKREKALKWLPIGDVWGIGPEYGKKLQYHGVKKAYQFTQLPDQWVRKQMTIEGLRLKRELEGIRAIEMEIPKRKKSISTTRSFDKMCTTLDELRERTTTYSSSCAEKLRGQKSYCNSITVFLQTNFFREDLAQANIDKTIRLPYPTNSTLEIVRFVNQALKEIYLPGFMYKRAGVIVSDITPENPTQSDLFDNSNPKHKLLMKTIDYVNTKVGTRKLILASEDPGRKWKMRQEKLSPRYTTRLDELVKINTE